jgi:hypothetical protein
LILICSDFDSQGKDSCNVSGSFLAIFRSDGELRVENQISPSRSGWFWHHRLKPKT